MRYLLECELFLANVRKHPVYALRKTLLCVPDLAHRSDEVILNPSVSPRDRKAVASAFQSAFSLSKKQDFRRKTFPYFSVPMGVLHHIQRMDCKNLLVVGV